MSYVDVRIHLDREVIEGDEENDPVYHYFVTALENRGVAGLTDETMDWIHEIISDSDYLYEEVAYALVQAMFLADNGQRIKIKGRY